MSQHYKNPNKSVDLVQQIIWKYLSKRDVTLPELVRYDVMEVNFITIFT